MVAEDMNLWSIVPITLDDFFEILYLAARIGGYLIPDKAIEWETWFLGFPILPRRRKFYAFKDG